MSEGWCSKEVVRPFGVGVWKTLGGGGGLFSRFVKYKVRDGSKIRFLHDLWCGDHPLTASFLELFGIACYKEAWVMDHVQFYNNNLQWNISCTIPVHDCVIFFILSSWDEVVCIKYVGSLPKGESSRLDLSIMSFAIPLAHHFLGKSIWRIRSPSREVFFFFFFFIIERGKRLQGRILSTLVPNGRENEWSYGNASKHLVKSGPFSQTMCFKVNTPRNFLSLLAVERMQIQGNIRNNIRIQANIQNIQANTSVLCVDNSVRKDFNFG